MKDTIMTALSDRKIVRIDTPHLLSLKVPQHISQTVKVTRQPIGNTYKAEWMPAREALWIAPSLLEAFRIRAVLPSEYGQAVCMKRAAQRCIRNLAAWMPWLHEGTWRQSLITLDGDIMHWTHTRHAQNDLDIKGF